MEIAYSVLLGGEVTPEGMEYTDKAEEFAHQCKAIAGQLLEQRDRCAFSGGVATTLPRHVFPREYF